MLVLPTLVRAAAIVNLDPATANYNGGVVDDGSATGSQSGIGLATAANGLTFNIEFAPVAGDLTGTALLMEIGGTSSGTGLYLINGVPTFVSKQGAADARVPEFTLPTADLDFADQSGGVNSLGVVAARSSLGALNPGQLYSVALTWDHTNRFQLAVESDGVVTTNTFTTTGTIGNWPGNSSLSVGLFSNKGFVGGLAGANASNNLGSPWDVDLATSFSGTILRALYWNASSSIVAVTNVGALTVTASSEIPGWPPASAIDSNGGTAWSSTSHGANSNATEWLALDYGKRVLMFGASLTPRPGGGCWPVDYCIESTTNSITWTTVPGMVFTNQVAPPVTMALTFSNAIFARGLRLYGTKLSPDGGLNHYLQIAEFKAIRPEPWANPAELRGKKVIDAGQYTTLFLDMSDAPTPKYLADHPAFLADHPFDGIAIPVSLDRSWCTNQGLITESYYPLQEMVMTRLSMPYSLVAEAITDLKRASWGHLTDNFLWYGVRDGTRGGDFDSRYPVAPDSSNDWAIVTQNAALCARICREAGLKGFMMDTEQYSTYASGELYPFGKGTPEVWRVRGQQWIQAVQSEFPAIKIMPFFSWGPESQPGGWAGYENLRHFMNGILGGIQSPARLIHGWEDTFWYGGRRILFDQGGIILNYPGDRAAFLQARNDIKNVWRNYSDNPAKYDQFVEAGMAAWVESDPYNLWDGLPSGYMIELPWSNLPYTLAHSDGYVWVWSAHSYYPVTPQVLNPFLASIANRTFNTGNEPAATFIENFQTDPMRRGWHFDFDMLAIGRELHGEPFLPVMNQDSIAYNWDSTNQAVRIRSAWNTGLNGEKAGTYAEQRRRYVHPVQPLARSNSFYAEFDFTVQNFGSDPTNPIVIGLFNSDSLVTTQSITLRIASATSASVAVAGDGSPWITNLTLSNSLATAKTYRISFDQNGVAGTFHAVLKDTSDGSIAGETGGSLPGSVGQFALDEAGIAQWDAGITATPPAQSHEYLLKRAALFPPAAVLSFGTAQPLTGSGLQFALQGLPGQTYRIESSTNLLNWTVAGNVIGTNSPVLFLDADATNHSCRFYRAVTTMP